MNERIFEIIQELNGRVGLDWSSENKAEFAEMIVRECAEQIAKWTPSKTENDFEEGAKYAYEEAANAIKEHFGVE